MALKEAADEVFKGSEERVLGSNSKGDPYYAEEENSATLSLEVVWTMEIYQAT